MRGCMQRTEFTARLSRSQFSPCRSCRFHAVCKEKKKMPACSWQLDFSKRCVAFSSGYSLVTHGGGGEEEEEEEEVEEEAEEEEEEEEKKKKE